MNKANPAHAVSAVIHEVTDFDKLQDIALSALSSPNPGKSDVYQYIVAAAITQANLFAEAGAFHKHIEDNGGAGLEDIVYDAASGTPVQPEVIAARMHKVFEALKAGVRLMTLERHKAGGRPQHFLMRFNIAHDQFITQTVPNGLSLKEIIESKSPEALLLIGKDLARTRSYAGNWGYDIDHFDSVLEYAFCDLMLLYLVPLSKIGSLDLVREQLGRAGNTGTIELLDSIVGFQQILMEAIKNRDFAKVYPIIAMVRVRQLYDLSTLIKLQIVESNDRQIFIDCVGYMQKENSRLRSGAKLRAEKLHEVLVQSDFGLKILFFHNHNKVVADEVQFAELEKAESSKLSSRLSAIEAHLLKKPIQVKELAERSVFAQELGIDRIDFVIDRKSKEIQATITTNEGIKYKLQINEKSDNQSQEWRLIKLYAMHVLASYNIEARDIKPENFASPNHVSKVDGVSKMIDVIDDNTAEVSQVTINDFLTQRGQILVAGPIGEIGEVQHALTATAHEAAGLSNTFDIRMLNLMYPPELEDRTDTSVRLGDTAETVRAKQRKRLAAATSNSSITRKKSGLTLAEAAAALGIELSETTETN